MSVWIKGFLAVALLAGLVACSGIAVNSDYDTSRQFTDLKLYAWMEPKQKLIVDPLVDNDLMNRRVQNAVEASLSSRGFSKAKPGQAADFMVTYHVSAEDKLSVDSFHSRFGYYPCWRGCFGFGHEFDRDISIRQYKQGTFMLDVIDPASSELIWRGVAGQRLNQGTPAERTAYVQNIVAAILDKFPPAQ